MLEPEHLVETCQLMFTFITTRTKHTYRLRCSGVAA